MLEKEIITINVTTIIFNGHLSTFKLGLLIKNFLKLFIN